MHVGSYVTHAWPMHQPMRASSGAYEWIVSTNYLLEAFGMHNHVRQPPVDEIELSNFELAAARRGTDPSASLGRRLAQQRIRGGARLDAPLLTPASSL